MPTRNQIGCFICLLVLLVSCRPEGVLTSRQMRDLLYDLHRTEGILQVAGYTYSHDVEQSGYYQSVLRAHGVTQAQFDSSLVWYTDHPERFNKIYPKVVKRLEAEMDMMETNASLMMLDSFAVVSEPEVKQEVACVYLSVDECIWQCVNGYENPWQIWTPMEAEDGLLPVKK